MSLARTTEDSTLRLHRLVDFDAVVVEEGSLRVVDFGQAAAVESCLERAMA